MGNESSIVFSGIAPHPPIMVPEVGGDSIAEVRGSIDAMAELTRRIIENGAETVVLVSPHAPLDSHAFVAYQRPDLCGNFAKFHAPAARVKFPLDYELLETITKTAAEKDYQVLGLGNYDLDHGTAVPLYFLQRYGWDGDLVALGYSFLSNEDHLSFGECIRKAADKLGKRVAFIASGDLSHRLKPDAPAGYYPAAYRFDDEILDALRQNSPAQIIDVDEDLRRKAGECGFRSILVALGAIRDLPESCEVLHYEAPFGVGYLVAQLTNAQTTKPATKNAAVDRSSNAVAGGKLPESSNLPALARRVIETFVRTGKQLAVSDEMAHTLSARAACFVSIKTRDGELRGCIGTIEPVKLTLAEELIVNAISAATRDPRFEPIKPQELGNLRYSVDVLSSPEPARYEDLNPAIYGVIVEDESGLYRGLLLPDIPGVDTVAKQVDIAARKAGIGQEKPLKLSRFRVQRFSEQQ
ncbi:MAG: AmmeMemoRadiSam system protein A [Pyrinomonadaceae bacterium]